MRTWIHLALLLLCLESSHAWAQESGDENADLDLIPTTLETAKEKTSPVAAPRHSGRIYLEDALTGWLNRRLLVPVHARLPDWQNRTSLDLDYSRHLAEKVRLSVSNRLNLIEADGVSFPSSGTLRNDFREGYLSCELFPRTYLEAGRINIKNGVSLGYNPTDFFKTRTSVDSASIDPSALRENRLGSLMVKGQGIWNNGSVTLAFSPSVESRSPLTTAQRSSFDPLFGQTNSHNRFLASFSYIDSVFNPQALVFIDDSGTHVGLNVSRVVGRNLVAYAEWSGVSETSLTKRAVRFGQNTSALPPVSPLLPQSDADKSFQNDLAVGASWTARFNLTVNLEYHYHQAGFGSGDFNRWVSLGKANASLASQFWFIRQYAADQQEPLMQHQIFLRLDWQDMIPSKLNAGAVLFLSPQDGSALLQSSAQYFISRNWTVGLYLGGALGGAGSVQGSLPRAASGVLQIVRYL
ncbi:MAG: hypothetical protein HXX11_08930 [Desulfuromonadales bacterium]|nr:hypothetical protein [Desulfuromonadales bacterium]